MSIYRFSDDSPIASVAFHYVDGAPAVALIEASKTATAEQIAAARKALGDRGIPLLPVTVDGHDMLQVSNFASEQLLINVLTAAQTIKGMPSITKEASDLPAPVKSKTKSFLENYSWRLAGALNLIGDISLHFGGYGQVTAKVDKAGNKLSPAARKETIIAGTYDLVGGGLYTVGGLNAAAFGNSKSKAAPLADRTDNFIAHTLDPQAVSLKSPKESGNFFRRHSADVTLAAYTAGAGVFFTRGLSKYQSLSKELRTTTDATKLADLKLDRQESAATMAYGGWGLFVKLLSLFIKEKPKSEHDKPKSHNPIVRAADWFREKPLRIFGLGNLVSETLLAMRAYRTYKRVKGTSGAGQKGDYIFPIITTIAYFASDFFSIFSSKNLISRPLDADGERDVIARAAQSIAAQSPEKRDALILQTAQFLDAQPEMKNAKKTSIIASLKNQVQHLGSNPWAERVEASEAVLQNQR